MCIRDRVSTQSTWEKKKKKQKQNLSLQKKMNNLKKSRMENKEQAHKNVGDDDEVVLEFEDIKQAKAQPQPKEINLVVNPQTQGVQGSQQVPLKQDSKVLVQPKKTPSQLIMAYTQLNNEIKSQQQQVFHEGMMKEMQETQKNQRQQSKIPSHVFQQAKEVPIQKQQSFKQQSKLMSQTQVKKKKKADNLKNNLQNDYFFHRITLAELSKYFETDLEKGISEAEAQKRNTEFGDNKLSDKGSVPWYVKLCKEMFVNMFNDMLWLGGVACFIAYGLSPSDPSNLYLGIVIICIGLITVLMSFYQSQKSESIMAAFKNFLPESCSVIREGVKKQIIAQKLVPGDVVEVKQGQKIPADLRILFSNNLKVDNSSLTGESDPQLRKVECTKADNPLETANLVFFGTLCTEGSGQGVVVSIGDQTIIGHIADVTHSQSSGKSPLRKELDRFVIIISIIATIISLAAVVAGAIRLKYNFVNCLVLFIGFMVANVPEGLVGSITVVLAVTAKKLSKLFVLVKNLEAVEALGSISCICSDKTGTLTQNKMTVEHIWYDQKLKVAPSKQKMGPKFQYEYNTEDQTFKVLHQCAICSSEATFDIDTKADKSKLVWQDQSVIGDATETALVKFFQPIEDILVTRNKVEIASQIDGNKAKMPFNSTEKYALCITKQKQGDSNFTLYLKGAPEKIWSYSTYILSQGKKKQITDEMTKDFQKVNKILGKKGERVLGFAQLLLPAEFGPDYKFDTTTPQKFNFPVTELTFVGLVALIDPPKVTVPPAVMTCRRAGIRVIMVTGDQPPTAATIGRQVNIIPDNAKTAEDIMDEYEARGEYLALEEAQKQCECIVVHGDQLRKVTEQDKKDGKGEDFTLLQWLDKKYIIFARTSPNQKLEIVKACQKKGFIVGVTGDGVNDSPAIKQADIGISMGISGSDVSKEAADMILLNDDFSSILTGIAEGRKIFDNLKKITLYVLTSNMPEFWPFIMTGIFNLPLALTTIMVLCIDVGTDIFPSLGLAMEDPENAVMLRPPRKKTDHLVTPNLVYFAYALWGSCESIAAYIGYFCVMHYYGFKMSSLFGILGIDGYKDVKLGDSCTGKEDSYTVDWLYNKDAKRDLRDVLVSCENGEWVVNKDVEWINCIGHGEKSSVYENHEICYSVEAVKYAQSSYFSIIVLTQIFNALVLKMRFGTLFTSAYNVNLFRGIFIELCILVFLTYTPGVQKVMGYRSVSGKFFFFPGILCGITALAVDEFRKYLIRDNVKNELWNRFIKEYIVW
eukprot:TRINITY_DN713_c0_g1_i2.p1 TRINITY_DN713_c0_g1~~TRINITY_DN713_c0_g1_i2.p1  ORF type:complete len:1261 (+),score=261.65 TRINITY_DN713_c0_g1_i2:187-3969(+)